MESSDDYSCEYSVLVRSLGHTGDQHTPMLRDNVLLGMEQGY